MENSKILSLIERIGNLLRSEERAVGSELGLQSVHIQILGYLSQCNRYSDTPISVSEFLGITKGTTSQSINVLNKKGFISKIPDGSDKRVVHLNLTEKGQDFVKNHLPAAEISSTLDYLNHEKSEKLWELLNLILVNLQFKNKNRLFGVCNTCKYFKKNGLGTAHQCGLTLEPLNDKESMLICREHEVSISTTV